MQTAKGPVMKLTLVTNVRTGQKLLFSKMDAHQKKVHEIRCTSKDVVIIIEEVEMYVEPKWVEGTDLKDTLGL